MLISYNWLQTYFKEKLPEPEKLGEILTFLAFELETIEKKDKDTILDIKVLPDRANYALCHRGIAQDLSANLGIKLVLPELKKVKTENLKKLEIFIENGDDCERYEARRVTNIKVGPSPKWLVERLDSIGQRSINNVVDIANFVMFDVGQPLHAFDANKVSGNLSIRRAKKGENMTTLDDREVLLDESMLIVADEKGPLGVAGIKGGNRAGVNDDTSDLILESAHFSSSLLRRTANKIGIRTDALKRFENNPSADNTQLAMEMFSSLISEVCEDAVFGEVVDQYPKKVESKIVKITTDKISKLLSVNITESEIIEKLKSINVIVTKVQDSLELKIPSGRTDLSIEEDIAEEVGRLIGYDKVPSVLPKKWDKQIEIPKSFYVEWKIREILIKSGFSEVMTSSFGSTGFFAIEKPLATDKSFARSDISSNFSKVVNSNLLNAPLLGTDETKIFEIGKVFSKSGETSALAIGVAGPKKKIAGQLDAVIEKISKEFSIKISGENKNGVFECNLNEIIEKSSEVSNWNIDLTQRPNKKFAHFSSYPFVVRDIALFVPMGTTSDEVLSEILNSAGSLVVKSGLFDRFEKDGKISYAFRLVFQSDEKTLTDTEVNHFMDAVYSAVVKKGWQVR